MGKEDTDEFIPTLDTDAAIKRLQDHNRSKGQPPEGIQQIATIRDTDPLSIGLKEMTISQPGMITDEELFFGGDSQRGCLVFGTSRDAVVQAVRDPASPRQNNPADPVIRKRLIKGACQLQSSDRGQYLVNIPAAARPDYDPFAGTGVEVPSAMRDGAPDIPSLKPGQVYLLTATQHSGEVGRETTFALRPIVDVAVDLDLNTLTEYVVGHRTQARVLADILMDRRVRRHWIQLAEDEVDADTAPNTEEVRRALAPDTELSDTVLRSALKHLRRVGTLALFVAADTTPRL